MIIPSYTEDDILRELLDDYKSVERKAKKVALKELEKIKNRGAGKEAKLVSEYFRTKNGNKWHITIVCNTGKNSPWAHRQHCVVELENGRKDVYYLRGLRFGKPYYVKIYSHALRRMRERFQPKEGYEIEANPDVMVDKIAFHPREQGFYQRLTYLLHRFILIQRKAKLRQQGNQISRPVSAQHQFNKVQSYSRPRREPRSWCNLSKTWAQSAGET